MTDANMTSTKRSFSSGESAARMMHLSYSVAGEVNLRQTRAEHSFDEDIADVVVETVHLKRRVELETEMKVERYKPK